ncbi:MAG TPA: NUDIX domain-containing protein [Candidatus Thermoplasmatota archaeon]|nr:NUDIX domain-containing protein [Candidatus Thermoplasmatota archaeon]
MTQARMHIEYDGRLYLVPDGNGRLRLPIEGESLPFPVKESRRGLVEGTPVVFAHPVLDRAPESWPWKDDVHGRTDVEELAKATVHRTMIRVVAKVALTKGPANAPDVLLVEPRQGFFEGRWSLPGGYVDYGESPAECIVREIEEELGVPCEVERYVSMESGVVPSGVHFLSVLFRGRLHSEDFRLKEDEIARVAWFPLEDAVRHVGGSLTGRGLARLSEPPAH